MDGEGNKKPWDASQLRKYDLTFDEIPRLHYKDPKIDEYIRANKPVVIIESNIIKPALQRWTLEYLEKNLGQTGHTCFVSKNHQFKYYDDKKIYDKTNNTKGVEFTPPTKKVEMRIEDFMKRVKEWKKGDDRIYLQQSLTTSVGNNIVEDFVKFDWDYVNGKQAKHNWGPLTSNLLFIAMEGNQTPCHYDEQENFFAQVQGYKRCILFPPSQFECLYPYPVHHPHDRQSMVDFEHPDNAKFPKFKDAKGCEAIVGPGDVLYIPIYWWHHIESLMRGGPTTTVNFWYKGGPSTLEYPLKDHQKVAISRNVEKMLLEVLQDPKEVGPLLSAMVLGRYTE
ncbi:hypothetical protein Zmor_004730 [Zophobas morio]|uniref:JmjC domain-containing protein n=1 Tax=Zophobas morio TaxID=2755281 RepID=A0AA38MJT6_9CUCU|nr:hypothetical protein Zmor_004730 [Zophobas morio]